MFSKFWEWFKRNHNAVIKSFQFFLFICVVVNSVIWAIAYFGIIAEEFSKFWIQGISILMIVIAAIILPILLISYLLPNDDTHIISGQTILDIIDQEEEEKTPEEKLKEYFTFKTQSTISRILSAIRQQERKSILNLILGIIFSILGVGGLLYIAFNLSYSPKDNLDFIANFLPRLSLVLLVETLAYFFLRLYKENLAEIKYWHNELTAIEYRLLAFNYSLQTNNQELLKEIALNFSKFDKYDRKINDKRDENLSADYLIQLAKALKK